MDWLKDFLKQRRIKSYGNRTDSSPKGEGYFGELPRTDEGGGDFSTELSLGTDQGLIPAIVPGQTKDNFKTLLGSQNITPDIIQTAILHAIERRKQGKSPFYQSGEAMPYSNGK